MQCGRKFYSTLDKFKGFVCFMRVQKRILLCVSFFVCLMIFTATNFLTILPWQPFQLEITPNTAACYQKVDFCYRPRPEANDSVVGEFLETAEPYRELLDKPLTIAIELTPTNAKDFIFVTASDSKFFHPAMDAIGNVQRLFPKRSIIFYDLDKKKSPADIAKVLSLCDVIYRKFNFTKYPHHVRELHNYAWKPLLITEVLSEYPALFYIDSAIRFLSNNFSLVFPQAIQNGGIVTFGFAGHTIFPTTHHRMYRYLPIPKAKAIDVPMREAGHVYVARTRDIYANVVRWWAACALVEPCIAPTMKRFCSFRGANAYAGCHRFDQSAFNILMANHFDYDARAYSYLNVSQSYDGVITVVRREGAPEENVTICQPNGQKELQKSKQYFG